jgi:DNA excision repair protein ERCC-6
VLDSLRERAVEALFDDEEEAEAPGGSAAGGHELEAAVVRERVAELTAARQQLLGALAASDADADAAGGSAGAGASAAAAADAAGPSSRRAAPAERRPRRPVQLIDDDDALLAGPAPGEGGGGGGGLLETRRDRLIRTGVLTPFDSLEGYERRSRAPPPRADAAVAPYLDAAGRSGKTLRQLVGQTTGRSEALAASRPSTVLLAPEQLPRLERDAGRVPAQFWRAAASGKSAPARGKRKRASTLPRAKRPRSSGKASAAAKRRRRAATGGGDGYSSSGGSSGGGLYDGGRSATSGSGGEASDGEDGSSSDSEARFVLRARPRACLQPLSPAPRSLPPPHLTVLRLFRPSARRPDAGLRQRQR